MLSNRNISLLLIFFLSYLILIPQLFGLGLSYDELATMTFTTSSVPNAIFWDNTPPLYYFLLKQWFLIFPATADSARVLNSIISSLFPVLGYIIADRFFGRKQALIAASLFLLSAIHIRYSLEIRSYLLFEVLCTANLYFFLKAIEEERLSVGYGVTILLTLGSHYLSIFWLLAEVFVFVAIEKRIRHRTWIYFLSLLIGLIIISQINLYSLEHLNLSTTDINVWSDSVLKNSLHYLSLIFLISLIFLYRDPRYRNLDLLSLAILVLLISSSVAVGKAPFVEKYFIFLIPVLLIRLGDLVTKVGRRSAIIILALYFGFNGVRTYQQFRKQHSGWGEFLNGATLGASTILLVDTNKPLERFYDLENSQLMQISEFSMEKTKADTILYLVTHAKETPDENKKLQSLKQIDSKLVGQESYEPIRVSIYKPEVK